MIRNTVSSSGTVQPEVSLENEVLASKNPRYRQAHRLADMSLGRIRRWGAPFRRPFHL